MKVSILLLVCSFGLTACGADLLGSAATGTVVKAQEVKQGKADLEKMTNQIQAATDATKKKNEQLDGN